MPSITAKKDGTGDIDLQPKQNAASCNVCQAVFQNYTDQREHMRSDWHSYNVKQRMHGLNTVTEPEFDQLLDELDLSISASDPSTSEDEKPKGRDKENALSSLLEKQAGLYDPTTSGNERDLSRKAPEGSPLLWFSSPLVDSHISLGVYKTLFSKEDLEKVDPVSALREKQLQPSAVRRQGQVAEVAFASANAEEPLIFICMIGGGHFAGMVVSLVPKVAKNAFGVEERQAAVVAHKTFHRYTTRRKQGGSQSANDASKGNAHSAGAGIRRHNEVALQTEVRELLTEWKTFIQRCELLFVRATGNTNRRTLFGPYEGQVLRQADPRLRTIPFSTRRATQSELMCAFVELTRLKVNEEIERPEQKRGPKPEETNTPQQNRSKKSEILEKKLSDEEEAALLHTTQLQALIRRAKAPAIVSYLNTHSLSPNFEFYPSGNHSNHHSPNLLHLAASNNSGAVVLVLLTKCGANPTIANSEGKVAFDMAGERATRDAFRIARSELGEDAWDWQKAHCPLPITKAEVEKRDQEERSDLQKVEEARRKSELARLNAERGAQADNRKVMPGQALGREELSAEDRREVESRGLTPEMRAKVERERRARAAEERIKRMTGK